MDDERAHAASAKRTKTTATRHLPHEIVTEILLQLPVTSLLWFRRVCKAWHATISKDPSFARAHLRLHRHNKNGPYLLIAPQIEAINVHDDDDGSDRNWETGSVATAGLYQWEEVHHTATLLHPMGSLPAEVTHNFTHCDGLVLAPTESVVRVINPATRRVLTLPLSLGGVAPRRTPSRSFSHQAFGLGRDPHSNTYKVARFFHRPERDPETANDRRFSFHRTEHYVPKVEVFVIGTNQQHWRETTLRPPYPVVPRQTATFFEGSLLWTIDQRGGEAAPGGFLRFMLDDETFHFVPPPLFSRGFNNTLSELCGRLFMTCIGNNDRTLDMWMCRDIIDGFPRWEKRYTIDWDWPQASLRPLAVLGNGILMCRTSGDGLCRCILKTQQSVEVKDIFSMNNLDYYNPNDVTLIQYPWESKSYFDVIPYVPSLVQI